MNVHCAAWKTSQLRPRSETPVFFAFKMKPDEVSHFAFGVQLFNQRKFFEAHEIWEKIWRSAEGDDKLFLQGMIQAAAALIHTTSRNRRGAFSLYEKCCMKLKRLPAVWMKVDLERFRADLALYFEGLRRFSTLGDEPQRRCSERLHRNRPPTIHWVSD
jgi:predicted metal-dependent hydrolase